MLRPSYIAFLKQLAAYGFTIFMLWLVYRHLGELNPKDLLLDVKGWMGLILASILVFVANSIRAWRWAIILNDKQNIRFSDTFSSTFLGLWFNIISSTGGNVIVKPYHLSLKTRSNYLKVFGSCIAELFFDSVFTSMMLIVSGIILYAFLDYNFFLAALIAFVVTSVTILSLLIRPYHKILKPLHWLLPEIWFRRIKIMIHRLNKGSYFFRNNMVLLNAIAVTIVYWSVHIIANYILLNSLSLPKELTGLNASIISTCFMSISMAIPGTVAGAGVINYGIVVAFQMLALSTGIITDPSINNNIFLFSMLVYLSNLFPDLIVGGYCYFKEKRFLVTSLNKS